MPDYLDKMAVFMDKGYGVMMPEYRGYSQQPGEITEQGLYLDATAAVDWLLEQGGHQIGNVVIYGESLGSGVAVETAKRYPEAGALILEAGFSSMVDVAKAHYPWLPVGLLLKDRYENIKKIPALDMPIYLIHGKKDNVVPYHLGAKLYHAAKPAQRYIVFIKEAGHNNLYEHDAGADILSFLEKDVKPVKSEQ